MSQFEFQVVIRRVVRATLRRITVARVLRRTIGRADPLVAITRVVTTTRDVTVTRDPGEATVRTKIATGVEAKRRRASEMTVSSMSVVKVRSVIGDGVFV